MADRGKLAALMPRVVFARLPACAAPGAKVCRGDAPGPGVPRRNGHARADPALVCGLVSNHAKHSAWTISKPRKRARRSMRPPNRPPLRRLERDRHRPISRVPRASHCQPPGLARHGSRQRRRPACHHATGCSTGRRAPADPSHVQVKPSRLDQPRQKPCPQAAPAAQSKIEGRCKLTPPTRSVNTRLGVRAVSSAGLEQGTSNSQVGGSSPPRLAIPPLLSFASGLSKSASNMRSAPGAPAQTFVAQASVPIGRCRRLSPVAANRALAIAGETGGTPGSPTPVA